MFTGLVTAVGTIRRADPRNGGVDLVIATPWHDIESGESIAVRGACLTAAEVDQGEFAVHVVHTTLERTCFGTMQVGDRVNLERSLRVGDRMGGHWVQGHVDAVGEVRAVVPGASAHLIDVQLPVAVAVVTIPLGSLAVDGVSLTVNAMPAVDLAQLAIVPFTLRHTTLGDLRVGDRVHLEGDLVGKHVRAMATPWAATREPT
jgi:riboflavin synthase